MCVRKLITSFNAECKNPGKDFFSRRCVWQVSAGNALSVSFADSSPRGGAKGGRGADGDVETNPAPQILTPQKTTAKHGALRLFYCA